MIELEDLLAKLPPNDVSITEPWLHIDRVPRINLPNYILGSFSARNGTRRGGTAFYIKKSFTLQILPPVFRQLTNTVNYALTNYEYERT